MYIFWVLDCTLYLKIEVQYLYLFSKHMYQYGLIWAYVYTFNCEKGLKLLFMFWGNVLLVGQLHFVYDMIEW